MITAGASPAIPRHHTNIAVNKANLVSAASQCRENCRTLALKPTAMGGLVLVNIVGEQQ